MNNRDKIVQGWLNEIFEEGDVSSMGKFNMGIRIKEKYKNLSDDDLAKKLNSLESDEIDSFM